jgi:murein DD-endopeptidase MepM/ murein hydrolase activator NlpD
MREIQLDAGDESVAAITQWILRCSSRHARIVQDVRMWTSDVERCFGFWAKMRSDCAICMRVCGFNRDYSKWRHRLWLRLALSPFRRVALWLDRNRGKRKRPSEWWSSPDHSSSPVSRNEAADRVCGSKIARRKAGSATAAAGSQSNPISFVLLVGVAQIILSSGAAAQSSAEHISLRANPGRICLTNRQPQYLNFDLIVGNGTRRELKVKELRATVLDREQAVEKRLIWSQALELLGAQRTIAASSEGLLFNPLIFNSLKPGRQIRYDIEFDGAPAPASITVSPEPCPTRTRLVLPLAGRVLVLDGYDLLSHHRRFHYLNPGMKAFGISDNPSRFALDLVVVDAAGRRSSGDGKRNEDWFGWGQPVRAPAEGVVVATHNDQPDNTIVGSENLWTDRSPAKNEMTLAGNFVLIDHGRGEFSLLSHLRSGSVLVRKGDRVRSRQIVAQVGNSGSSLMPHVHYELRSGWGLRGVTSSPPHFRDLRVSGTGETGGATGVALDTGDVVQAR